MSAPSTTTAPPSLAARVLLHPVALCILLAIALVGIGDQYPFSPFPMYSRIDGKAEVLYVTDEKDQPLPLSKMFAHGSAQLKKRYESNLQDVAQTKDWWKASEAQRQEASARFLDREMEKLDEAKRRKYPANELKVWMISVTMEGSDFRKEHVFMGSKPLPALKP